MSPKKTSNLSRAFTIRWLLLHFGHWNKFFLRSVLRIGPHSVLIQGEASISENVGGLNNYFSRIWASKVYKGIRKSGKGFLENLPQAHHIARKVETQMKAMVAPGSIF